VPRPNVGRRVAAYNHRITWWRDIKIFCLHWWTLHMCHLTSTKKQ